MLEDISQIKVGYFTVDVKITSTEDYGEFDHETKKITISNSISDLEKFNTLLHECFHAILFERGLSADGGFLFDNKLRIIFVEPNVNISISSVNTA